MMIPLTPDVQARLVMCNNKQRSLPNPQNNSSLTPRSKDDAPYFPSKPDVSKPDVSKPRPEATSQVNVGDNQPAPIKLKRIRALKSQNNTLRRSLSAQDISTPSTFSDPPSQRKCTRELRRSQSMLTIRQTQNSNADTTENFADEEKTREIEIKIAEKAALPSRIRYMRHILGFRKYNKLPDLRKRIMDTCSLIETMAQSQHGAYQLALDQVEKGLTELTRAEHTYFRETDRVRRYEARVDELDYLKANIELCIKESMAAVKTQYYAKHQEGGGDKKSETEPRKWRDSKEIRIYVNQLKVSLATEQEKDEQCGNVPSLWSIQQEIREARARCAQQHDWHNLHPLFDAKNELLELQGHLDKIQRSESLLKTSLLRYQASTNTLINVNREIRATTRILTAKAILASRISDSETRDLEEEERLLREFVATGRRFDDSSVCPSFGVTPENQLPTADLESPITPPTSPPVWMTKWSPKTKVLNRHQYKEFSETWKQG